MIDEATANGNRRRGACSRPWVLPLLVAGVWLVVAGSSLLTLKTMLAGGLALARGRPPVPATMLGRLSRGHEAGVVVTAEPAILVADGESTASLKAVVRDAAGQPAPDGTLVGWSTTLGRLREPSAVGEAEVDATVVTGTWQTYHDDRFGPASGGGYLWSDDAGASLVWSFTASAVLVRYGQAPGRPATFTVQIDAGAPVSLTTTAPVTAWHHAVVGRDLAAARHVMTVAVASGPIAIDGFVAACAAVGGVATNVLSAGTDLGAAKVTATAYLSETVARGSTEVTFTAGPPAAVQLDSAAAYLPIGGATATLQARVLDAWKRPVPDGTAVRFATTLGSIAPEQAPTVDGQATAVLRSGTEVGIAVVQATADGVRGAREVAFVAGPPARLTLEVTPGSIPANSVANADLTAYVADGWGNPVVDGTSVRFDATLGSIAPHEASTRAGLASSRLTAGAVAGSSRVTAIAGSAVDVIEVTLTALDAWVHKEVEPQTAVVPGETVSYTVSFGNVAKGTIYGLVIEEPLPEGLLWPRITADGPALNALPDRPALAWQVPRLRSGESGVITVAVRVDPRRRWGNRTVITNSVRVDSPTAAELTAANNLAGAAIVVVPGAAYTVTVEAPDRLVVGGESGPVVATVTDRFGNPARDDTVVRFSTDLGAVSPSEAVTTRGLATTTFTTDTRAGVARVRAITAEGRGGSDVIRLLPLDVASLAVDVSPGRLVVGGATMPITVTAADRFANAVSGVNVALAIDRGTIEPGFGRTGARGFVTNTLTSPTQTGPANVVAVAGDLRAEGNVLFVPGDVHEVRLEPRARRVALGRLVAVEAIVQDRFANPIAASRVFFATSNGSVEPAMALTAADGRAVGVLRPVRTGAAVVTALAAGIMGSARVDVTPALVHLPFVSRPR